MAGVGVERGLQRNTHHDENRLLERNLHQTNRKNLAHDTLVSTVARGKDVRERWRWSVRRLLTNNLKNGTMKNHGFPVITKPIPGNDGSFLGGTTRTGPPRLPSSLGRIGR
jgi:hypothetical protein